MTTHRVSKHELISDIRRVARVLGHSPSSVEYKRAGRYHVRTLQRRFKTSWNEIIATAGLRYTARTSHRIPTTRELRSDLMRVVGELGHVPSRTQYQSHGRFDSETIRRRSGKKNWEDALTELASFNREQIKLSQSRGGVYRTSEEWLSKLKRLSIELGHAPTTAEANAAGINAHQLRLRLTANWTGVLGAAGIDLRKRSRQAKILSTATQTMLEDVFRVSRHLGRAPKAWEYAQHGKYNHTTISNRLGGWKRVKKLVRQRINREVENAVTDKRPFSAGTLEPYDLHVTPH